MSVVYKHYVMSIPEMKRRDRDDVEEIPEDVKLLEEEEAGEMERRIEDEREKILRDEIEAALTGKAKPSLCAFVRGVVGNDVLAIFGETRTGKTTFCCTLALEAARRYKMPVIYVDTEGNIPISFTTELIEYHYFNSTSDIRGLLHDVIKRKEKPKLFIIDSIITPVLSDLSRMTMFERGRVQLELISLVGDLKRFARRARATVVVVLHPISRLTLSRRLEGVARKLSQQMQQQGMMRRRQQQVMTPEELPDEIKMMYDAPVGGKALFLTKEIWMTHVDFTGYTRNLISSRDITEDMWRKLNAMGVSFDSTITKCMIYAHESRVYAKLEKLVSMYITTGKREERQTPVIMYSVLAPIRRWQEPEIVC